MRSFIAPALLFVLSQADAQGIVQDQYSPIVEWRQPSGMPVKPIHVIVLPSGDLYFVEPFFAMTPSRYSAPPPAFVDVQTTEHVLQNGCDPVTGICEAKALSCSGHALMADGKLFFAGGSYGREDISKPGQLILSSGISDSVNYEFASKTWSRNPDSIGIGSPTSRPLRWYPTVTRLADSRMMLTGGYENLTPVFGPHNRSVEAFNPVANNWAVVSDFNATPAGIANMDYTHVYQFPTLAPSKSGDAGDNVVLMLGGSAEPLQMGMRGSQSVWQPSANLRPGAQKFIADKAPSPVQPNHGSTSAMLPLRLPEAGWGYANGSLINVGGEHGSAMESNIDVYEPGLNRWRASIPMIGRRHHPNATILPDGRIVILAGHADEGVDLTGYAEYIDPKNNFAHSVGVAHMPEVRGYHSMVALMPDGRVFVGGGNDDGHAGTEKPNFRYYYPDYMFKPRPEIFSAPAAITVGKSFAVLVPHASDVDEMAILALGSMTHSFDMAQRSVQLRLNAAHRTIRLQGNRQVPVDAGQCGPRRAACYDVYSVQAPASSALAPPGHYMLFALNKERVPSVAKIVRLAP